MNILTDAVASASSVNKNDTLHCGAHLAVDYDVSTAWVSADSLASINIKLVRPATFSSVSIIEGENSIRRFDLEILADGKYKSVYSSPLIPEPTGQSFMGYGLIEFTLPQAVTTDQLRVTINQSNGTPAIYSIRLTQGKQ